MQEKICSVEGCDNQVHCRTFCRKHYARWYRHGDPMKALPRGKPAMAILAQNTATGQSLAFSSQQEAARVLRISQSNISTHLSRNDPKSCCKWVFTKEKREQ